MHFTSKGCNCNSMIMDPCTSSAWAAWAAWASAGRAYHAVQLFSYFAFGLDLKAAPQQSHKATKEGQPSRDSRDPPGQTSELRNACVWLQHAGAPGHTRHSTWATFLRRQNPINPTDYESASATKSQRKFGRTNCPKYCSYPLAPWPLGLASLGTAWLPWVPT